MQTGAGQDQISVSEEGPGQAGSEPLDEAMCKKWGVGSGGRYPIKRLEESNNLIWTTKDRALRAGCSRWREQHE